MLASSARRVFISVLLLMTASLRADQQNTENSQRIEDLTVAKRDDLKQRSEPVDRDFEATPVDSLPTTFDDIERRSFDRIGGISSLGGFQKKAFDRIESLSALGGLQKRHFDRIESGSSLGGLYKRRPQQYQEQVIDDDLAADDADTNFKRSFDKIGGASSLGGLQAKRMFDRIDGMSALGGLEKRSFDRIAGVSSLGGLVKRPFDRIGGISSLGGLIGGLQKKRQEPRPF